jgi:hypothetical protein
LQINALNGKRNGLALYRDSLINQQLMHPWDTLVFDHDPVKTSFYNYVRRMVDTMNPDYLVLGVEANLLIRNKRQLWQSYCNLITYVYIQIKKTQPALPVGISLFCAPFFPQWSTSDTLALQQQGLAAIEPYTDFIAFTAHPFISALKCDSLPPDYLNRLFAFTQKPVAVSECSYSAQEWTYPGVGVFYGSAQKQNTFLSQLLQASSDRRALFCIWFTVRDYDTLWHQTLQENPDALPWRDSGLFDEAGISRPALALWKQWLQLPVLLHEEKQRVPKTLIAYRISRDVNTLRITFNNVNGNTNRAVTIFTLSGRMIYSGSSGLDNSVRCRSIPAGIYILKIENGRFCSFTYAIIVR